MGRCQLSASLCMLAVVSASTQQGLPTHLAGLETMRGERIVSERPRLSQKSATET